MTESDDNQSQLNHHAIAQEIALKNLGEIFSVPSAEGVMPSMEDFRKIEELFRSHNRIPIAKSHADILASPAFCVFETTEGIVAYKDTALNLSFYKKAKDQIDEVLSHYPDAYSAVINALTAKIPVSERDGYEMVPYNTSADSRLHFALDLLPLSVIKALRQTTDDPNKRNLM